MASATAGDPQSWNRYTYVGNNPLNATDPTGMVTRETIDNTFRRKDVGPYGELASATKWDSTIDFWLDVLNNRVPNNFRSMVCAFLTSAEYQQRFGAAITRTDRDCSQELAFDCGLTAERR